jgi:hypothetical protein
LRWRNPAIEQRLGQQVGENSTAWATAVTRGTGVLTRVHDGGIYGGWGGCVDEIGAAMEVGSCLPYGVWDARAANCSTQTSRFLRPSARLDNKHHPQGHIERCRPQIDRGIEHTLPAERARRTTANFMAPHLCPASGTAQSSYCASSSTCGVQCGAAVGQSLIDRIHASNLRAVCHTACAQAIGF